MADLAPLRINPKARSQQGALGKIRSFGCIRLLLILLAGAMCAVGLAMFDPSPSKDCGSLEWKMYRTKFALDDLRRRWFPPAIPASVNSLPELPKDLATRPLRGNGVLCFDTWEQLNNHICQLESALGLARDLNRTVVVPKTISNLYDVSVLQLSAPEGESGLMVSTNETLCEIDRIRYGKHRPKDDWDTRKIVRSEKFGVEDLKHITNKALFIAGRKVMLGVKHHRIHEHNFFQFLYAHADTRRIADEFIATHFGSKPFVAV
jgi:hypothetical protein